MFLSRIELDTRRNETRRAVASPGVLHAAAEGCFPQREGGNARKLWRLDALHGKLYLLLLSPERPDFTGFAAQFCSADVSGEVRDYAPLLGRIEPGGKWRFRLKANPVYSKSTPDGKRGKLHAHTTLEHQTQWLLDRAEPNGFSLRPEDFAIVAQDSMRFAKGLSREAGREVIIGTVTYEGVLTVSDAALLKKALTEGIGRAKAYGCGLLTVAAPT